MKRGKGIQTNVLVYLDSYPDYEQSWMFEATGSFAIPHAGLIAKKSDDSSMGVVFQDDEFPGLFPEKDNGPHR